MTGLKQELMDRVSRDLDDIEKALRASLTPHLDLVPARGHAAP